MSFRERSAWMMALILLVTGGFYVKLVVLDGVPPPAAAIPFVLFVVVLSVTAQVVLAIASPREAAGASDERERRATDKAAHFSSYVLATGMVVGLGGFLVSPTGMQLFHIVLMTLILGQIADYAAQIVLLRWRV